MTVAIRVDLLSALAAFLILAACAPTTKRVVIDDEAVKREALKQQEIALQELMKNQERLLRVGGNVLQGAVPMCEDDTLWVIGAVFISKHEFAPERQEAAASVFHMDDKMRALLVIEGGPAAGAGLQVGDEIVSMNGVPPPVGQDAARELYRYQQEQTKDGAPVTLITRRDGENATLTINPVRICDYPLLLVEDDGVNAFADGTTIVVTTGMMRFAQDDTELSLVIAHELAHNTMNHMTARRTNATVGLFFDIALAVLTGVNTQGLFSQIGANAYSKDFEAEADYVGMYMLALSGGDIEAAPRFWRRMAVAHPASIQETGYLGTHPASPERFVALEETVVEIRDKQAKGLPLEPEMKVPGEDAADARAASGERFGLGN
ncbi:MAG: M48 family metallopeptidase [Gammaproteobacteria bacterium]|nr:M48 family metallopeptidase [Gammaproteobacteria bacterium]MCI0591781.1 M48 family metallopeptidase [Gammaproteobacteria bacterium]